MYNDCFSHLESIHNKPFNYFVILDKFFMSAFRK